MQIDWNHHAYLLIGGEPEFLAEVALGTEYVRLEFNLFGIGQSRQLREASSLRPSEGKKRIFGITARRYTTEAQNALLKLFEEPPVGTHFFILHQRASDFLPTLLSRVQIIDLKQKPEADDLETLGQIYLALTPADRLVRSQKIFEAEEIDWRLFLRGLEAGLANTKQKKSLNFLKAGEEVKRARRLLAVRGSAAKLIVEHLALTMPTMI